MTRDHILHRIRTALGRSAGQAASPDVPPVRLVVPEMDREARIRSFTERLEALGGKVQRAATPGRGARAGGRGHRGQERGGFERAVAGGVRHHGSGGRGDRHHGPGSSCRSAAPRCKVGITSADYALADTGSLVMLSSAQEARLISLLPPEHIAVVPMERLLTGLDELFTVLPRPAEQTSSMVLITGPSRTADIEQILVRGAHGPGQVLAILVG